MLTHQTTRFGTKFKNRQRRGIVDIQRCVDQIFQLIIQLLPLICSELAALDFLTRNFTDIGNQTIYQLYITHFKREQRNRIPEIYRYILCHRKHKCRFTHSRTGSDNNKVRVLPTGSHLVQLGITTLQATQTIGTGSSFLNQLIRLTNHRIDLRIVFLHVPLRNLK